MPITYRSVKGSNLTPTEVDANFEFLEDRVAYVALSSDQSNSTTTPTEVVGLTYPVGVGVWNFQYTIIYQAAANTTGVRFSVNCDGTTTAFVANVYYVDTNASIAGGNVDQDVTTTGLVGAFSARAPSVAGWGTTITQDTAAENCLMQITGQMVVSVAGNIELWHGSEVAAETTVKAGSGLILTKLA